MLANYGVKPRVVAAELRMDVLFAHRGGTPAFKQLPKHPAITRDLALVADDAVPAADIASRIRKAAGKALESLTLFDVYTGEHMAPGKKSLAYSLVLRAADRTLTDEEAENAVKRYWRTWRRSAWNCAAENGVRTGMGLPVSPAPMLLRRCFAGSPKYRLRRFCPKCLHRRLF